MSLCGLCVETFPHEGFLLWWWICLFPDYNDMNCDLHALIYASIPLFYCQGIPGKFISLEGRWRSPVKHIQMTRWVASDFWWWEAIKKIKKKVLLSNDPKLLAHNSYSVSGETKQLLISLLRFCQMWVDIIDISCKLLLQSNSISLSVLSGSMGLKVIKFDLFIDSKQKQQRVLREVVVSTVTVWDSKLKETTVKYQISQSFCPQSPYP